MQRALLAWHAEYGLPAPWRESRDPYASLVAAVMAQQTQMSRVMPSYERFMAAYPSLAALAAASVGDVIRTWAGMGYNQRAVRLHRAAQRVAAEGWPRDATSLARIDGIGPFTAAIVASFAFDARAACVDTNVRRVLGRLAGDERIDGARLRALADTALAREAPGRWNQALMDYGALVCTARPRCGECVVARWCASRELLASKLAVGDERAPYVAQRPRTRQTPFAGSVRWYRGRIIDALRALPPGATVPVAALGDRIAGAGVPAPGDLLRVLGRLERDGLVVLRGGDVALPE